MSVLARGLPTILKLAFPNLPAWLAPLLVELAIQTIAAVKDIEKADESMEGEEKFLLASDKLEAFLKRSTADVPGWKKIHPRRRRKLIGGLIELAVFIMDISDGELEHSNKAPSSAASMGSAAERVQRGNVE